MASFSDRFTSSDQYVEHLAEIAEQVNDFHLKSRYVGFMAVTAVSVFELSFKDILIEFAEKKNRVFGVHVRSTYKRLNGRISLNDIRNDHIPKFGDRYKKRFERELDQEEKQSLQAGSGSIKSSYGNILTWRHKFVHGEATGQTATLEEALSSYERGKKVLDCVNRAMRR